MKHLIWILIIICTLLTKSFAQVTADFSTDITEACSSASVTFTNNSIPDTGLAYQWDFGNGHTSSLKNPTAAYTHPGLYTVTLTVTDGVNSDTQTKTNYISIWSLPEAALEIIGNISGCAPFNRQFVDSSVPGNGTLTNWKWDFGDGTLSNEQNPTHIYEFQNNYSVSITVTDEHGCSDIGFADSVISVYKPHASFIADYISACSPQQDVNFYNNSYGDGNLLYEWDFGDSNISYEQNPVHTYNTNGIFDISLTVTDKHSCTDTLLKEKYINLSGVDAAFSVNKDTLCSDEKLILTNTSANAYNYIWDFGDGTSSDEKNPSHIYTQPGTYEIILKAFHATGCSDSYSKIINVENIVADFNLSDNYSCQVPVEIQYNNLSVNAEVYEWHLGNGTLSDEKNPKVVYSENGIYSDTLIVYSPHGCKAEKIIDSAVVIRIPRAYFTPNQLDDSWGIKGCTPLTVNFFDKSFYNNSYDSIEQYYWDFGDGTSSNEINPSHIFYGVGKSLVRYYFVTKRGCVSANYYAIARTGTKQNADFYKNLPDTVCASQAVQFFDDSQDSTLVDEWYWRFGDGYYSMKKNPVHMYADTGYMDVKLQAYYNGCGAAELKEKYIYIKGPVIAPEYDIDCKNPYDAILKSNAIDAEKVYWDFGDGSPVDSINFNPIHTYPENKVYTYNLFTVNKSNNCSYNLSDIVIIKDIKALFNNDTTYGCENLEINVNSKESEDEYYFKKDNTYGLYYWDFGDGTSIHTNNSDISHTYLKKGTYNLKLLVKDFRGCADSSEQKIKIYKPETEFEAENMSGCMPINIDFINKVQSDTTISFWKWDFGDESVSNEQNPSHIYDKFGIYNVSLQVTDTLGCTGKLTKINYIEAMQPIPDFIADDMTICLGDTVSFIPADTDRIASYWWDFGDGISSSEQYPEHIYDTAGYYPVTLTLVDNHGCDSTRTITDYIYMQNIPQPKFSSTDSVSECYPLTVNFEDTTNNSDVIDWLWDFGDGETSSHLKFPEHIYTAPGLYNVSLNLTTSNGCRNEILKSDFINIKGPYAEIIAPDTVCRNENVTLTADKKRDVFELQWIFGDGATSFSDTTVHAYDNIGYVRPVLLLKSDAAGTCDIYLEDSIYIPQLIPVINTTDNLFSGCMPFQLNASNNCNDADSWFWNFGDGNYSSVPNPHHIYSNSGTYFLELNISNKFGCSDSSSVPVEIFALPNIDVSADTLICRGEELSLTADGAQAYEWYPKIWLSEDNPNIPLAKPDSTITYSVTGTDFNGCRNTSSVTVRVQQIPKVNLKDTSIIIGETVLFDAYSKDIATYDWFPDYNINCTYCPSVAVNPVESTVYSLTVTDTANCFTVTYDVNIDILKKFTVDVPNAFTPNNDGINDVLYAEGWGIENLTDFKIFNRYGEIVFETNNKNEGWDGTYKGKLQNIETYTYLITVQTYDNKFITKRGTVKLLK